MKKYYFIFFLLLSQYILSAPSCIENEKGCEKCNFLTNQCIKCKNDALIPDDNGGCIGSGICELGMNYCEKCNEKGNLCETCEEGYFPDENGGCSNSNKCQLSYRGECFQCQDIYFLVIKTKSCKSLYSSDLKYCKNINEYNGLCDFCEEGFYLGEGDKKCVSTENCFTSSFGICNSCNQGYYLDKKREKCIEQNNSFLHCKETVNSINCDKCDDDYFFLKMDFV